MPEYRLDTCGASPEFEALDDFARGFIEAAFFSETSCYDGSEFFDDEPQERIAEGQADGNIPSDASAADLSPQAIKDVAEFCAEFQARAADLLSEAYGRDYDEAQAGRDLYFTCAGHGVGFWSRDELSQGGLGDRLSEAAGRGEVNLSAERAETDSGFTVEIDLY